MNKQLRFLSWAAVSSTKQAHEDKDSLNNQLRVNRQHIEKWDGVLVDELTVAESRSISTLEVAAQTIKAYADLRAMIARRAFDVLIYLDRSRLGRKASLTMTIVQLCNDAGIITYATESPPTVLEPPGRNFAHNVMGAIESVLAQEEVVKIQARHEMGMAARVRNGNFPGRIPFGWVVRYEIENDSRPVQIIEIDEEAKATVEIIYEMYLHGGRSLRAIADHLLAIGAPPPRGQPWKHSVVEVIIDHAWRYAGFVELNRRSKKRMYIRAKLRWPSLITEELAKAIVAERKRRAGAKRAVGSVHRFSQIVWCEKCQGKLYARYVLRVSRKDATVRKHVEDFLCAIDGIPSHPKSHISGQYLYEAVYGAIAFVQVEANRERILSEHADRTPQIRRNLQKAQARLEKHEEAAQRADDAYVMGKMTMERYQRQVDNLESERKRISLDVARLEEELEAEYFDSQRSLRLEEFASEGRAWLESPDLVAANAWFRRHIKIWVNNESEEQRIWVDYL